MNTKLYEADYFRLLLTEYGFELKEELYDKKNFGNFYVIFTSASSSLLIRLVKDRGNLDLQVNNKEYFNKGSLNDSWESLFWIKKFIEGITSLHKPLTIEESVLFLRTHFHEIEDLFCARKFVKTVNDIKAIYQE